MEILEKIEELRQEMHRLALFHGIDHPKVIKISQEIDELMNLYDRLKTCRQK